MFEIPVRQWWERGLGIVICGAIAFAGNSSLAQITPDSTLPNNSNVTLDSGTFNITGGTQAGANLFHSFQQFSVPTNFTASFNNAVDIQNIISRVTGGSISNIDGLIRANGTANLFLINPNGIIFGPNASLNIGGSFVGSTANAIQFGNNGIFSASTLEAPSPLLTINPSALLFNQIAAASIQNSSVAPAGQAPSGGISSGLRVPDGRSLLLVGGDIKMDGGGLRAYGGRVELGGLASPGTVGLEVNGNNLSLLSFPDNATRADVSLTNGANVNVSAAGGGSIAVNARNLNISGESSLLAGIGQGLGSEGAVAGDITLDATGEIKVVSSGGVFNVVFPQAVGNGGNITVSSDSFSLTDGAEVLASTLGQGNAGSVSVRASNSVDLVNGRILSTVEQGGVGKSGNININAASLSLKDSAQLRSIVRGAFDNVPAGRGDAGNVTVDVTGPVTITGTKNGFPSGISTDVGTGATGNGGNISISSGSFSLTDGAVLGASILGQGNAGSVSVRASDSVELVNNAYIFSTVERGGVGNGGNININAATLSLKDGAQLLTLVREARNNQPAGRGNAGNVTVNVTGSVTIAGRKDTIRSAISSEVRRGATGNGGNISISSGSFSLTDDAEVVASTFGQGNAGNVSVRASNSIELANTAGIFSAVGEGGVGNGGNINIKAAALSLKNGAQLLTLVREASGNLPAGRGDAGNVTVDVAGNVTIAGVKEGNPSGIFSLVGTGAIGKGGNIAISSGDFSLTDGAQLSASTFGQGNAGNITADVTGNVTIAGIKEGEPSGIRTLVGTGATGKGGNIAISSGSFSLTDGAQLSASTFGQGNAGNITADVTGNVTIAGIKEGQASEISSKVRTGATGTGGNISISSGSFSLTDGAQLTASTSGQGNAGSVSVRASDSVELANTVVIFSTVEAGGVGKGGNININAASMSLKEGAQLQTSVLEAFNNLPAGRGDAGNVTVDVTGPVTIAGVKNEFPSAIFSVVQTGVTGNGGKISISSGSFSLTDGAVLSVSTLGQGNAGNVSVRAFNAVELVNGGILSTVEREGVGNGGNININAATLSLKDRAAITASSAGKGTAGNIEVDTRSIRLSDRSTISSNTVAGQGNINLRPRDLLLLRRGSNITTNATGTATGGNITINTNNLVAVPKENTDISANAQESFGGRVNINTKGIFGIQFRQQDTPFSDITASSALGPQFSGSVEINRPDVDPTQGLVELPVNLVDASQQIDTSCRPDSRQQRGSFVITGRGGLRPSPYDMLTPQVVNLNLATLEATSASGSSASPVSKETTTKPPEPIVEATGWVKNDKGEIFLTANLPVVMPHSPWLKPASCSARREAE
ncbi:filamentous hemagglutinin N-terminal domain-containing protein [Scytonema sp. PCC 10023]|uniref:two-partner secretion domain-containing protein n=1 Tax=Scytonema sp. PCC 10023 TaxID=1680591 RepID=UPI0039C72119